MPQFTVDDDLAALVWQLARPQPFENLSFSAALRRILKGQEVPAANHEKRDTLNELLAESIAYAKAAPKKAPSPSPLEWVATVPELKGKRGLNTWRAICDTLKIDTAGDSARRKLKNWVRSNRPMWPAVPDID
jgi:hypothetical protein